MKRLKNILGIGGGLFGAAILVGMVCVFCLPSFIVLIEMVFPHEQPAPRPEETIGSYQCITDVAYFYPFQDGMRYAEYQYSQVSFDGNPYFKQMTPERMERVGTFIENFSWWINTFEGSAEEDALRLYSAYDYDRTVLSEDDFYYVTTSSDNYPFSEYRLYIFDTECMILYYMELN